MHVCCCPTGILIALDDVQRFKGTEADGKFLAQLNANHAPPNAAALTSPQAKGSNGPATGGHPNYVVPRFHADVFFGVQHYAGEVFYDVTGFNDRNSDALSLDVRDLLAASTAPLVQVCVILNIYVQTCDSLIFTCYWLPYTYQCHII